MKNIKILLCVLSLFVLTGCESKNSLVKYLEEDAYECLNNVCVKESSESDSVKVTTTYDIDNKLLDRETKYTSFQTSSFKYNWDTKIATIEYKLIDETFNASYNYETYEFECTSNSKDEAYKKAECDNLKEDIINNVNAFKEVIKSSKYEIK